MFDQAQSSRTQLNKISFALPLVRLLFSALALLTWVCVARDQLWNLSKEPIAGFRHAFFTLRNGLKLHYITNRSQTGRPHPGNLIVLLHGWPDSCMMWRHLLQEPAIPVHSADFVCVDLPGFGGSDSFERYDTSVLEALTEFIVALKESHMQNGAATLEKSTIVVGHDWGAAIAFRLASEAPALADRFVTMNGPLVRYRISCVIASLTMRTGGTCRRQQRRNAPIIV